MKLALIALVFGTGACVADDADPAARVDFTDNVTPMNVGEMEQAHMGPDHIDHQIVVITGAELPNHMTDSTHIDISNVDLLDADPSVRAYCALTQDLPVTDVCSSLCSNNFAARVFGTNGSQGDCTNQTCVLGGGTTINVDVCL